MSVNELGAPTDVAGSAIGSVADRSEPPDQLTESELEPVFFAVRRRGQHKAGS